MHSKLMAACLALVAFAAMALVPAMASAQTLEETNGTTVPAGTKIDATQSTSIIFDTSSGNVTCSESTLTGTVTQEGAGVPVKGTVETAKFTGPGGGRCTSTIIFNPTFQVTVENLHYCLEGSQAADTWSIKACTAGQNLKFTLHSNLGFSCTYERASVTGTFETGKDLTLKVGASQTFSVIAGSSSACPTSGTLTGGWNLYTDTGVHDNTTALVITAS